MSKLSHYIVVFVLFTLGVTLVHADFLGVYEPGETIRFGIICLNSTLGADIGCTAPGARILGPLDETANNITSFYEASDALLPGLWRGNYTVGAGNQSGTWMIQINLTGSNVGPDLHSYVHHFQVVGDNRGLDTVGRNVNATLQNASLINTILNDTGIIKLNVNTTLDNTVTINSNVLECPARVWAQNVTAFFNYNITDYRLINSTTNYTGMNVFVNETFIYTNTSFLNKTVRRVHYG